MKIQTHDAHNGVSEEIIDRVNKGHPVQIKLTAHARLEEQELESFAEWAKHIPGLRTGCLRFTKEGAVELTLRIEPLHPHVRSLVAGKLKGSNIPIETINESHL